MDDGVPPLALPEPEAEFLQDEEEDLLVDDCGNCYIRAGSNKVKRLMRLKDLCPNEVVLPTKKLAVATATNFRNNPTGDLGSNRISTMDEDELDYAENNL